MELNFSRIEAQHLLEQTYVSTQHIPLAIYVPGSTPLLENSLSCQLHGNFFRITRPEEVEARNCAAVVVAAEDVELMSTALMQFAYAVHQGHDLADADAVYSGETIQFSASPRTPIAVMTKALFLRAAQEVASPGEILHRAGAMAQNRFHFSWCLVRCPRPLRQSDLFSPGRKRALLLSHEYSMTGAPLVLVTMVPVLKELGYDVAVLSPTWGAAAPQFAAAGATVLTSAEQLDDPALLQLALDCDLVLANTVEETDAVRKLSQTSVNVLWWLHDTSLRYPSIMDRIPRCLGDNVRIFAVGEIAKAAMHTVRPEFPIGQLLYGLPDLMREPRANRDFTKEGRLLFVNVGTVEMRKGQDILAQAIRKLSPLQREKAHFLFVGKPAFPEIYREIEQLAHQYPETVSHIPILTREEIKALMNQCHCVVCSSRDDPMPTFVTEAAMFGKPAIVSEYTGTASLIRHGENGLIYQHNSPAALAQLLQEVICHPEVLERMAPACRALYEAHFTQDAFHDAVRDILKTL